MSTHRPRTEERQLFSERLWLYLFYVLIIVWQLNQFTLLFAFNLFFKSAINALPPLRVHCVCFQHVFLRYKQCRKPETHFTHEADVSTYN